MTGSRDIQQRIWNSGNGKYIRQASILYVASVKYIFWSFGMLLGNSAWWSFVLAAQFWRQRAHCQGGFWGYLNIFDRWPFPTDSCAVCREKKWRHWWITYKFTLKNKHAKGSILWLSSKLSCQLRMCGGEISPWHPLAASPLAAKGWGIWKKSWQPNSVIQLKYLEMIDLSNSNHYGTAVVPEIFYLNGTIPIMANHG